MIRIIEPDYDDTARCFFFGVMICCGAWHVTVMLQISPCVKFMLGYDPDIAYSDFEIQVLAFAGIAIQIGKETNDDG